MEAGGRGLPSLQKPDEGTTILIVDDDAECLEEICEFLTHYKFTVETASSVNKAITHFEAKDFNLLLLDLEIPNMSGLELARSLFGDSFPQRTILMTGHYEKAHAIFEQYGEALSVLRKPLKLQTLLATINAKAIPPASAPSKDR